MERVGAIGCALSNLSCGRSSGRYRPVSKSAAVGTRLLDLLLPLLGTRALSRVFNRLRHVKARAFSKAAPVLWNTLPSTIKAAASLACFKIGLKTYLFKAAFL